MLAVFHPVLAGAASWVVVKIGGMKCQVIVVVTSGELQVLVVQVGLH